MKHLLELQDTYITALKKSVTKPIELLEAAKFAMGNRISECGITGCTVDNRCNYCTSWSKVWEDIDAFLKDNDESRI